MGLLSGPMTDSWADWGILEANDWLMAHSDDSGDPKIRRACEEIVKDTGRRSARVNPIPSSGRTKESPSPSDDSTLEG
jgi:hypothetical protein